jgi:isopenicillin-N epimerase
LREATAAVAAFLGSDADDLVFVPNVTTGMNAVLQSVMLDEGDEVVMTDLAYGAVTLAAQSVCARTGAVLRTAHIAHPVHDDSDVVEPILAAIGPRTRLVIVDHVTSQTALVLPVAVIAAECRARGVPVLVDGAHAPGSRHVSIPALGGDWYSANLHKWAHAPRPCGILWAPPGRQAMLHAPVVSWGANRGFRDEFEHTATSDPTMFLAAPEGIALLHEWNFEACVAYMHRLAWDGAHLLAERWRTVFDVPRHMVGAMATVPLAQAAGTSDEDSARLRLALLVEHQIEVHLHAWRNRLWARVSAQVYNEEADIIRLGEAVVRLIDRA